MRGFLELTIVIIGGYFLFMYGPELPLLPEAFTRDGKGPEFFGFLGAGLIVAYAVKLHWQRKGARRR